MKPVPFEPLDPGVYRDLVRRALAEDYGWGDVTSEGVIDRDQKARGVIVTRSGCVLAGLDIASEAFRQLAPGVAVTSHFKDSDRCEPGATVAEYRGHAGPLLTAERTALNFLQRLSGIATLTRQFVEAADGRIMILDTRKTTPLMRALEKYAVRAGGGVNHRSGLDDGILIKDNHVRLAGGVEKAVTRMRKGNREMPTEVEVRSLDEVDAAIRAGAEIILLDNLRTAEIVEAVKRCHGVARTEISGGVTLPRMRELAATGADFVSIGALTHSAPAADLSFEIEPE